VGAPWPVRTLNLTAKLKDAANASAPELSFQHKAVEDFHACQAQVSLPASEINHRPALPTPTSRLHSPTPPSTASTTPKKQDIYSITDDSDTDDKPEPGMSLLSLKNVSYLTLPLLQLEKGVLQHHQWHHQCHRSSSMTWSPRMMMTIYMPQVWVFRLISAYRIYGSLTQSHILTTVDAGKKKCPTLGNPVAVMRMASSLMWMSSRSRTIRSRVKTNSKM